MLGARYVYTSADVQRLVEQKRKEKVNKGTFNIAAEKARLIRERDYAKQNQDFELAAQCVPSNSLG